MARLVLETVLLGLDRGRFPWVAEDREPTEPERLAAVIGTAALIATQRVRTARMNEGAADQQEDVRAALLGAGFTEIPRRTVRNLREAPQPGEFCRSGLFGRRDADLLVGLWDDRTMPIECKVSNDSTNSVKRLNNDAAQKAVIWIRSFGDVQCVPVAVLSGVFNLRNLRDAQNDGLTLIWAHDLDALLDWIEQTRP